MRREAHDGPVRRKARKVAEARREREQAMSTVEAFAKRYVAERAGTSAAGPPDPAYFGEMPLRDVTLSERAWRRVARSQDRVLQRGGVPLAALDPPGGRGGGADRPGTAEKFAEPAVRL